MVRLPIIIIEQISIRVKIVKQSVDPRYLIAQQFTVNIILPSPVTLVITSFPIPSVHFRSEPCNTVFIDQIDVVAIYKCSSYLQTDAPKSIQNAVYFLHFITCSFSAFSKIEPRHSIIRIPSVYVQLTIGFCLINMSRPIAPKRKQAILY